MAKIISRRVVSNIPKKINRILDIKNFWEKRNKILIIRAVGGLGDILMHRMLFEDLKLIMPDAEIHFACPEQYHEAVQDHPFIDKVLSCDKVDRTDYIVWYNTSTACVQYEAKIAPKADLHRSDIWSRHCGFNLTRHDMHISLSDQEMIKGKEILEKYRDREGKIVVFSPVSSMIQKNLLDHQVIGTIQELHSKGYCVIGLHSTPIPVMNMRKLPVIYGVSIRQWMSVIHQADYVISVDTSTFHCAGGMNKPTVGIFTFADGKIYGRYYKNFELAQMHRDTDPEWTCGPCYNWCECIKTKVGLRPCLTELTSGRILKAFDRLLQKQA